MNTKFRAVNTFPPAVKTTAKERSKVLLSKTLTKIRPPKWFNVGLSVMLLGAIVFTVMRVVFATAPNPGHSITEIDWPVVTKTGTATLTDAERVVLADATSAAFTLTLPTAAANAPYDVFYIKKIDSALANIVTIDANASETIDGLLTITLANRGETVTLQSDGTNWRVISRRAYDVSGYRTKGSTLNQWYSSPNSGTALTTGAGTVNVLRAIPFVVSKTMTIDQMAINVTTVGAGGAGTARVGIYADDGNSYPGALVVDAGTAVTTATGVKTFTTGLPVTIDPGLYWLAYVHGNSTTAPTMRAFAVASLTPVLGYASTLPANAQFGWSVAFTYAALPATFTAGGAAITAVPIWAVFVRTST